MSEKKKESLGERFFRMAKGGKLSRSGGRAAARTLRGQDQSQKAKNERKKRRDKEK